MAENVYRDAIDLLRSRGWTKGEIEDYQGRLCAEGALAGGCGAEFTFTIPTMVKHRVSEVIREQFPDRAPFVWMFNDHPDTTFDDVVLVLEKAAVQLDEQVAA